MKKLRIFISDTHNPWFNLATEDWMFRQLDPEIPTLFLWRNQETVVIGRFQNPWIECQTKKMEEDGVILARRQSGGGAVFQDLGNTNFTFLGKGNRESKHDNNLILFRALARLGVQANASGRNDLVVEFEDGPRKFSGSAFKESRERYFHHGTLLLNANLTKLGDYLSPSKKKLEGKGIKSVRSRVCNLSEIAPEINHESVCDVLIEEFCSHYNGITVPEVLNKNSLKNISTLNDYYEKLKDWNWRFGETPDFGHQMSEMFSFGELSIHLDIHDAKIQNLKIFSDTLFPQMIEELLAVLKGAAYNEESIQEKIELVISNLPECSESLLEFSTWFCSQIK